MNLKEFQGPASLTVEQQFKLRQIKNDLNKTADVSMCAEFAIKLLQVEYGRVNMLKHMIENGGLG